MIRGLCKQAAKVSKIEYFMKPFEKDFQLKIWSTRLLYRLALLQDLTTRWSGDQTAASLNFILYNQNKKWPEYAQAITFTVTPM
jgi:hypothetical protein